MYARIYSVCVYVRACISVYAYNFKLTASKPWSKTTRWANSGCSRIWKRSVGRVVQLQFWKGCALCHFLGFDKKWNFPWFRALQPKNAPSLLLLDLGTFLDVYSIQKPNSSVIEANLHFTPALHWKKRFGKFSPTTHCFDVVNHLSRHLLSCRHRRRVTFQH